MKLSALFICLSLVMSMSCTDDATANAEIDYLIFGHFYGECSGEVCIEIFRIDAKQISEDINDTYPNSNDFYNGQFVPLDQEVFLQVNNLREEFERKLLNEDEVVIGQPDAGDWGGIYLEYKSGSTRRFWLIDQKKDNLPTYLYNFHDAINARLNILSSL